METAKKNLTVNYAAMNILYFIAFCSVHAYAVNYLLDKGFSNTEVGVLLALANIISAVSQPIVAQWIDGPGKITNKGVIIFSSMVILVGSLLLRIVSSNKVSVFIIYALIYMIQFVYQPVMTAICFEYMKAGANIMYGLARGLGSAGFAVCSAFLGRAVENHGVDVILYVNVASMAALVIITLLMKKPSGAEETDDTSATAEMKQAGGIGHFVKKYPSFMLFLIGTICMYFAHNMINDFMIQIIRSLNGAETQMGYATSLQAFLELPMMACIGILLKRFSANKLLIFSALFFTIKVAILIFATNMAGMYVSQCCQFFAYALFIPAAAYYVSSNMDENDQVKGQAFITSAITLGGVFSNLICGRILDSFGVSEMILTGTAVSAIGTVIAFMAMRKENN